VELVFEDPDQGAAAGTSVGNYSVSDHALHHLLCLLTHVIVVYRRHEDLAASLDEVGESSISDVDFSSFF